MREVRLRKYAQTCIQNSIEFCCYKGSGTQESSSICKFPLHKQLEIRRHIVRMMKRIEKGREARKRGKSPSRIDTQVREDLKTIGMQLFRVFNAYKRKPRLANYFGSETSLILKVDDFTRRFPWELMYDGDSFLFTKYSAGRIVIKSESDFEKPSGSKPLTRRALVVGLNYVGGPKEIREYKRRKLESLDCAEREARYVRKQLRKRGYTPKLLIGKDATVKNVENALKDGVAVFHFTGHGRYRTHQPEEERGVICLHDGDLSSADIEKCFRSELGAPYLSFINACESSKEIYSSKIPDAFISYGAENLVSTLWLVYDEDSSVIARRFYRQLVEGETIGEALRKARKNLPTKRSLATWGTWPSYILYGNPEGTLPSGQSIR